MEIGWMIGIIEMTYRHTLLFEWKLIWNFTRFRCFASVWLFERGSLQDLSRPPKESPVLSQLMFRYEWMPRHAIADAKYVFTLVYIPSGNQTWL
jgi:hypothetical protein